MDGEKPREVHELKGGDEAIEIAAGQQGTSLYMHHNDGWTVFEDLFSVFSFLSSQSWLKFAGDKRLVVAGYDESLMCAELVVTAGGSVVREFMETEDELVNEGNEPPAENWVDVASFADGDWLSFSKTGTLLIF